MAGAPRMSRAGENGDILAKPGPALGADLRGQENGIPA